MSDEYKQPLFQTLIILEEYLSVIVIIGGWVPLLYYHYLLRDSSITPIRTQDIDIGVNNKVPIRGGEKISQLFDEAGIRLEYRNRGIPPITHYKGLISGYEVEIEFITNLVGQGNTIAIDFQDGLTAQALRILMENTLELTIDDFMNKGKTIPIKVKVPTPAAFILHKGLIYARRGDKMAKDLYYIFDILVNSGAIIDDIYVELKGLKHTYSPWFRTFIRNIERDFSDIASRGVSMIYEQRLPNSFPALDDGQFKQYALSSFRELIRNVK